MWSHRSVFGFGTFFAECEILDHFQPHRLMSVISLYCVDDADMTTYMTATMNNTKQSIRGINKYLCILINFCDFSFPSLLAKSEIVDHVFNSRTLRNTSNMLIFKFSFRACLHAIERQA